MKTTLLIPFSLLLFTFFFPGCRLSRYTLDESCDGQTIQVKSGDRVSIELEENATTGYIWLAECDDPDITIVRETLDPDDDAPLCGAPRKVRFIIRVARGFDDTTHVKFTYKRPWKGGETARTINVILFRKVEDTAPWRS